MDTGKHGDVVLVTGGAGFLGQHIVRLLQEKDDDCREIRVFDRVSYVNKLGHHERVPVTSIIGDLRSKADVLKAVTGVDTVVHTAGVVSILTFPDDALMEQVNVQGTANILEACIQQNVARLVNTSSVTVVSGCDGVENGDESAPRPEKFLFPGYSITKGNAENMVIEANGRELSKGDGSTISTISLRPIPIYGEEDPLTIEALRNAKEMGGTLPRIGNGSKLYQQAYAGNIAWGHILAMKALRKKPATVGGRCFNLTDDTPLRNYFDQLEPWLNARGYRLTSWYIPYPVIYILLYLMELFFWLMSPIFKMNSKTALNGIIYVNKTYWYSRKQAEELLGYTPLYSFEQSFKNSVQYYMDVDV